MIGKNLAKRIAEDQKALTVKPNMHKMFEELPNDHGGEHCAPASPPADQQNAALCQYHYSVPAVRCCDESDPLAAREDDP